MMREGPVCQGKEHLPAIDRLYLPNLLHLTTIFGMSLNHHLTRRLAPVLLLLILAAAAALRFYNLAWDGGTYAHPDERSTLLFYAPTIRWPADSSTLLDPRASTLNPFWDASQQSRRSYTYGHFPLYTLVLTAHGLNNLAPLTASFLPDAWTHFLEQSTSGRGYTLIGRSLMALADLFSVYLLFLLGRRLYGLWGGLLAAALSAFTVLQIQLAHFFAVDPISTTFTLLALYGAVLMYDRPSRSAALITGIGVGLAVASKFSALPVAFAPLVAAYFAAKRPPTIDRQPPKGETSGEIDSSSFSLQPSSFGRMFGLAGLALLVAVIIFAVTSPFVLLDFENFERAVIEEQGNMVSGLADFPFTRQYRGTWAYGYFIDQQLRWGMGWPLGLLALAGTLWVVFKAIRGKATPGEWIVLCWIVLYFGPTGLFLAKFMRYMVPVVPLFTLFGAGLVVALWRSGEEEQRTASAERQAGGAEDYQRGAPGEESEIFPLPPRTHLPPRRALLGRVHGGAPLLAKAARPAVIILAVMVLAGSAFWALAFVNGVYGSEHPWVTFSRWTYANVPDGSCIAREHWDEGIPANLDEPNGNALAHAYIQPELPMYEEDTREKYERLRGTLMNCDYIALASNRLWRTIPRLPERYPMSTRYYEALFSGALGFEQIYSVETPPRLGPFTIDDQSADESFTVYDHPRPILFKKTRQLSVEEWDALLGNTWQGAVPGYTGPPTLLMRLRGAADPLQALSLPPPEERQGKSLMLDRPVDQLPPVNDFRWNSLTSESTLAAVIFWWLGVMLIGLLALPLTLLLFNHLPDRGYVLSKSLGLLLVSYFVWLNSSLGWLNNTVTTAVIGLVFLGGFSLWGVVGRRYPFKQWWREQRSLILVTEVVFSLVYLFFIYLRLLNPDLWQPWLGGEKMLEIGFLHAVVKSAQMPPYDPFFAGGILNYYYYGLFLVGVLIKLTGIQPTIAFNLAVPTLAALTAANVFSLAGNLSQSSIINGQLSITNSQPINRKSKIPSGHAVVNLKYIVSGLLGILFVVFIGNLEGAAQFMRELGKVSQSDFQSAIPGLQTFVLALSGLAEVFRGAVIAVYNYWDPTRVIPATINEFPYFSFLFADLHPHMIGLPFTVLFLSLAYNWLGVETMRRGSDETGGEETKERESLEPSSQTEFSFPLAHLSFTNPLTRALAAAPPRLLAASLLPIFIRWLALPFVLGAIAAINTWDLPTYLGLMVATFLMGRYLQEREALAPARVLLLLAGGALFGAALLGVTYLLYLPFFANYQPPAETGLGLVHTQTALDQHLKIWGFFLLILASWLWVSLLYPGSRNPLLRGLSLGLRRWNVWPHLAEIYRAVVKIPKSQPALGGAGLVLFSAVALALLGYPVPAYLLPLAALALLLLFRREAPAGVAYLGVLIFTGLLVLLGLEFFFLRDFLGGSEYYRMNTLFKFYIQVWVMFGIAAAVILPRLWLWSERWPLPGLLLWRLSLVSLLLACLIYPVLGTRTRVDDRFPGEDNRPPSGTLDGLAYMTVGVFEWPAGSPIHLSYDYEAIHWLQDNVPGTPIMAEAKVGYYREGGMRVAAYTGLPSVLGGLHQNEQRYPWQVGDRDFVVNEFWSSPDPARTLQLIHELNISYIYDGQIERITHGAFISNKFEQLRAQGALELVFENEQTRIYKVVR
ncbi:MAG: glycosyltransferase family 39 protein [Anaerolineales bacterium]|nr:glycosyltransferase family 39 protein [Anaerolineales bacterium]